MPWKEVTIMFQKEEFIKEALNKNIPFGHLCKNMGISRTAGYRILKRYHQLGLKGLQPQSKAPHFSPTKTKKTIEDDILNLRQQHPTWGARKLHAFLLKQKYQNLPAISTINGILKRHGCISPEESLKRQPFIRFEHEAPNDLWQMDFKGWFMLSINQPCHPLTILDDHSRFSVGLRACANQQRLTVQEQLIGVFEQYGLPLRINVDNGNPWGSSTGVRHTQLTVWLMQLGIQVSHSSPYHPQTNGKDERFHRTLKQDVLSRQTIHDFTQAQRVFDEWREIYNYQRPHEAIAMATPSERYVYSQRTLPNKLPDIQYSQGAIIRKARANGYISYQNKEFLIGEAFKHHFIEIRHRPLEQEIDLYFDKYLIYSYPIK